MGTAVGSALPDAIFRSGFEQFTLTINDYLSWCSVSENGGVPSTSPPPAVFPEGSVVALHAEPSSALFVWGYWTGTDAGDPDHSQDASVTMTADRTVLACCPFASDPGGTCP